MSKINSSDRKLTRRQIARREREHRSQQLITWAAIGIGAVIVLILAYGSITEIMKARKPVATVGETSIMAKDFKSRQSYERWMTQLQVYQYQNYITQLSSQQAETPAVEGPADEGASSGEDDAAAVDDGTTALIQQLQYTLSSLEQQLSPDFTNLYAGQVLDAMIAEELARQEAATRGWTVSEDEIQQRIELTVGYDREAASDTLSDTETVTDTEVTAFEQPSFDELYEQFDTNVLKIARFSEDNFREMIAAQLLGQRLAEELADGVETLREQVELTVFTVDTEDEGLALQSRINDDGEDVALLVEELTQDENPNSAGYDLPWLPLGYLDGQFGTEFEKAAFNTATGKASAPVLGASEQYFVIFVKGHEERELSEDLLSQAKQQAYEDWLTAAKDSLVEYLDWEAAIVTE